ncbi:MAG: cell division ATP-binding protein FtsE, partial [Eubacterium sp.]
MIEFINVTKAYDKNEKDALNNVNLFIDKGEFVFLVGRSG